MDQLLNASPMERRVLIEETAGIAKYKIRKAEAERKLESTRQNLVRVRDIISEVKRQIQSLDRQVKRAETYNTMHAQAQQLSMLLLAHEYHSVHGDWQGVSGQAQQAQVKESALQAQLSSLDADVQNTKAGLGQEEQNLTGFRQQVYERKTQSHRHENRIELLLSQIQSWEEQLSQLARRQDQMDQAERQAVDQVEEFSQKRQTADQSLKQLEERLKARGQAEEKLDARIVQSKSSAEEDKIHIFEILSLITEAKNQAAAMESRHQEIIRVQEKGRAELTVVMVQIQRTEKELEDEKSVLISLEKTVVEDQLKKSRLSQLIQEKQDALAHAEQKAGQLREERTRVETRLISTRENEKNLMAAKISLQEHLQGQQKLLDQFVGIVADGISVAQEYEKAIEAVLGDRLQALIVDNHLTVQQAIRHFKANSAPRSVFIPKTLRMKPGISATKVRQGVIGPALTGVTVRPGFETLFQALLGGVVVVQDIATALDIWKEQPLSETLVTLDGEVVFPSGMVIGGQPQDEGQGFLQTRRKLRELEKAVQQLTFELAGIEGNKNRIKGELEQRLTEEEARVQSQHQAELEATARRQKGAAFERQMGTLSEHRSLLQIEERQRLQEIEDLEKRIEKAKQQIQSLEDEHTQFQNKMDQTQEDLKQWEPQRTDLSSEMTQLKVDLTVLTERRETLIRETQRLEQEQQRFKEKRQQQKTEIETLTSRVKTAQRDIGETEETVGTLIRELTEMEASMALKTQEYTDHMSRLKQLDEQQSSIRREWSRIERSLKEHEVREAELRIKLEYLSEQLGTGHSISPEEALSKLDQEPIHLEESQGKLSEFRKKLEQMGPVNLAAPEEYKELNERYHFLTTQEADLTRSMEDIQEAIQKISKTTCDKFLSAYQALKAKFAEVFSTFFEGGRADLILQDENNPLETGIEIIAQPPGKRRLNISLLSGGEKALTAIALLFASFLIHPSPFCILDEIDAPLDEENTRRFLRVLRQMTNHSQFLVITHNRRTMEQADVLYGVTMQEPGISKTVSVKLESNGNGGAAKRRSVKTDVAPSVTL